MSHTPPMPHSSPQPSGPGGAPGWGVVPPVPPPGGGHSPMGQPTTPKPSHRKAWLTHGATAFVALMVGTGIGNSGDSGSTDNSAAPAPAVTVTKTAAAERGEPKPAVTVTQKVTVAPKPAKKPGPATTVGGEGQYLVGDDMQAGTYKTAGPDEGSFIKNCYWARTKDASGEFGAIIANENLKGQGRVTVNKGEYFETKGCQKWTKVG
ncbi:MULTISPECIES: hypothetical protein [unclassified Streptomyces]|uniref:hypothetical protein n=1 Tax=unclassified Streptomyces TaxID=2593676 RepID=UPI002DD982FF|nr:hypothetical protein [Streptomyces sp. NBC_01788]WSB29198.1 hypothetical protein OIE49_26680 [Streptomyces sp. NBC_01788]